MDYRRWSQTPENFPGTCGALFMKFNESRQARHNVTDESVRWYCGSWKAVRECVARATNERELRQQLFDGITAISKRGTGPATTNTYVRCLHAFANWLLELEYIERRIELPKQKTEKRVRRFSLPWTSEWSLSLRVQPKQIRRPSSPILASRSHRNPLMRRSTPRPASPLTEFRF